jgi:hypothetical protein
MVMHDILVRGVDMTGTEQKPPVLLQMNDDDFPGRFLKDLASPGQPPISSAKVVTGSTLFQPVQRILNVALADLECNSLSYPRVDPTRVLSAGLVIRRCIRKAGLNNGPAYDDTNSLAAWMRNPSGQFQWAPLAQHQANLDPDPTQRPQLSSGQPALDLQLAAISLAAASTESTTPAFAAPPATCAALNRTVLYAVIPTASSEVSDTPPRQPVQIDPAALDNRLPALLSSSQTAPGPPAPGQAVDYRWMSDDFVNANLSVSQAGLFRGFSLALRMLHTVFGAFDGTPGGNSILAFLNQYNVAFGTSPNVTTQRMGDFYRRAKSVLFDYNGYPPSTSIAPIVTMPSAWDPIPDNSPLVTALIAALTPRSQNILAPQGRFQDSTRQYRLRLFFRIKGETPGCPPELVWSHYSEPFRIAAWHEAGERSHPPIPLPDPTAAFLSSAKPNCAFQVPGSLMGAMQGASLSGLMKGSGGCPPLTLNWICGFNIPLITICAFFVLNIFLSLLNIIFFWLPFIKICIPFPLPSPSTPDEGTP